MPRRIVAHAAPLKLLRNKVELNFRLRGQCPTLTGAHLQDTKLIAGPLLAVAGYIFAVSIFFRAAILSGFDLGFGDRADAMIEISILEHWRSAFLGYSNWNTTFYFYPYPDTLGYNDGYFLSGAIYSIWRIFFDPFHSDTMTALTYKTVGYIGMLGLVRGVLHWRWSAAVLVAVLATISNNMYLQSGHAQIQTLALLPLLATLAVLTVRAELHRRALAQLYAALAAVLVGVWLITTFYFAWFAMYFAVTFVGCWLWVTGRRSLKALIVLAEHHWRTLMVFACVGVVASFPFFLTYVPKRIETGGHGFMISYLVQPTDLTNVGEQNILWGWIYRALDAGVYGFFKSDSVQRSLFSWEHKSGYPIAIFIFISSAAYKLVRKSNSDNVTRAFAMAVVISWAMTVRIGPVSPWIFVHFLVPASSGVRVVLRYQLFLVLPVLVLAGIAYRDRLAHLLATRVWAGLGLITLLVVEQLNFAQPAELSRAAQFAALNAIPTPPKGCKVFYVVVARPQESVFRDARLNTLYPHNVDAMFLAERWRIPTINGFSTFNPKDWDFASPYTKDYDLRVMEYAKRHELRGLCRLDMRTSMPWARM